MGLLNQLSDHAAANEFIGVLGAPAKVALQSLALGGGIGALSHLIHGDNSLKDDVTSGLKRGAFLAGMRLIPNFTFGRAALKMSPNADIFTWFDNPFRFLPAYTAPVLNGMAYGAMADQLVSGGKHPIIGGLVGSATYAPLAYYGVHRSDLPDFSPSALRRMDSISDSNGGWWK